MNPFEMVVLIVAIVAVARIMQAKYGVHRHRDRDRDTGEPLAPDPDVHRLREELRGLKERVAVLERIATDGEGTASLERQIDALRRRD